MKRAIKKKSGLADYLRALNVLQAGNEQAIDLARKEYWRKYKAEWRNKKRHKDVVFTIEYTAHEVKQVNEAARKLKRSRTAYIKEASIAFASQQFIVPDVFAVAEIKALLTMHFSFFKQLADENAIQYSQGASILERILELEHAVLRQLQFPLTVEEWIREAVTNNPERKEAIFQMINRD